MSIWISVDPLADKYPSLTPYAMVANNPVMLYDPDGMRLKIVFRDENGKKVKIKIKRTEDVDKLKDIDNGFAKNVYETLNYLEGEGELTKAIERKKTLTIQEGSNTEFQYFNGAVLSYNSNQGLEIVNDENAAKPINDRVGTGEVQSPAMGFLHEIAHFNHYADFDKRKHYEFSLIPAGLFRNAEEMRVINNIENPAALRLGEPTRSNHYGIPVEVSGPTSREVIFKRKGERSPRGL